MQYYAYMRSRFSCFWATINISIPYELYCTHKHTHTHTHTQQQLTIVLRRLFCMHTFRIEPRSNMGKTCRDIHFGIAPMLVHKTVKSFLLKLFTLNLHISYMFCVYKYSKVFKHRTAAANRSHTNKPPHPKCTGIVAAFVVRCVCARNNQ